MPFQWNVQPYQFLQELRAEYTTTTMVVARGAAEQVAAEATQWMKDNAPWTDRTGQARAGLQAFVRANRDESATYSALESEARNKDALLLDELNAIIRERRERARTRVVTLKTIGNVAGARQLQKNIRNQRQYRNLRTVPVGRSAVRALQTQWRGTRAPLVDVVFRHRPGLRYAIWLEIANQGRYAIISRAIDYWGPRIMNRIRSLHNLVQYRDKISLSDIQTPQGLNETAAQRFEAYVADKRRWGEPYTPWGQESKSRRKKRKRYYNPEEARERRAQNKQYIESQSRTRR